VSSSTLIPIDTGRRKPYMLEITTHDVPMRGLPESMQGTTIAHMSDFHGGFGNTGPVYEEAIARVNALKPDLVLLTGDYIDDHATAKNYPMAEHLSRFKARLGVFVSFGNHDHRQGIVGSRRMLEQAGVHILNNESLCLEGGLWLAGVDDLFEGKPDVARALADLPHERTSLVLSHNPRLIERVRDRDVFILSGHTHGGQIALPFPTPKMVCLFHLRCSQVAGWYRNGRASLYVNRGLGVTGKPFRYNCPAEIGIFRLVPESESVETAQDAPTAMPEAVGRR
jgi:predicted MPP superfamily phosphohydrolase